MKIKHSLVDSNLEIYDKSPNTIRIGNVCKEQSYYWGNEGKKSMLSQFLCFHHKRKPFLDENLYIEQIIYVLPLSVVGQKIK